MAAEKIVNLSNFHPRPLSSAQLNAVTRPPACVIPFVHPRLKAQLGAQVRAHHAEPDLLWYRERIERGEYTVDSRELAELIVDILFEDG